MNVFTASSKIVLGRQTENEICTIQFPIAKWIEQFGSGGTFHLYNKRSRDANAYPVVITSDEEFVYWTLTTADVQYAGIGEAQLDYTFGTYGQPGYRKACSEIFKTYVEQSLETSETVPQPYQAWVTQVSGYADSAEESAEDSEAWAVGQRNGVDVPSTDPAYHNNAKYYAEIGGAGDFDVLTNRPKYNGSVMTHSTDIPEVKTATWDAKADVSAIPTKTSDLTNDSGFLTEHQSLDAYRTASAQDTIDNGKQATLVSGTNIKTVNNQSLLGSGNIEISGSGAVNSVNGKTGTVVLDAEDVGALPDSTVIPSKTSELTNDSGFLTEHQSLVGYATQAWVNAQGFITSLVGYATEAWVNAQGFLKEHQSLAAYRTSSDQDTIDASKVPNTRTVNGHALSSDVTIADTDIAHGQSTVGAELTSQSSQIVSLGNTKEAKGKMTISGTEHTVVTHTVTIVDSGVTTTMTLLGV